MSKPIVVEVEPCAEEVDGIALLYDLEATLLRFVVFPKGHMVLAVAAWVLASYVYDAFGLFPYLLVSSPEKRCGKSTLLALLKRLCNRTLMAGNISAAGAARVVEKCRPTLLLDEGDTFLDPKLNPDLVGILNDGHTADGTYVRCDGKDNEVRVFQTFCPKAVAMIGKPKDTLRDRSIEVRLQRSAPGERKERFIRVRVEDYGLERLARSCARWAADNRVELVGHTLEPPTDLHDRAADNWLPLLVVAHTLGGEAFERVEAAALALEGDVEDDSFKIQFLRDVRGVFDRHSSYALGGASIREALNTLEDAPWSELRAGKGLSGNQFHNWLREFGVTPHRTNKARLYYRDDPEYPQHSLEPVFRKYLETQDDLQDRDHPLFKGAG